MFFRFRQWSILAGTGARYFDTPLRHVEAISGNWWSLADLHSMRWPFMAATTREDGQAKVTILLVQSMSFNLQPFWNYLDHELILLICLGMACKATQWPVCVLGRYRVAHSYWHSSAVIEQGSFRNTEQWKCRVPLVIAVDINTAHFRKSHLKHWTMEVRDASSAERALWGFLRSACSLWFACGPRLIRFLDYIRSYCDYYFISCLLGASFWFRKHIWLFAAWVRGLFYIDFLDSRCSVTESGSVAWIYLCWEFGQAMRRSLLPLLSGNMTQSVNLPFAWAAVCSLVHILNQLPISMSYVDCHV